MVTKKNTTPRKKVSKAVAPKIVLTVKQALSLQGWMAKNKKSFKFLDSKLASV